MKGRRFRVVCSHAAFVFLLFLPALLQAQGPPPVEAPLVREGDFAVELLPALDMGSTRDEIEAESRLGDAGIAPRNGWIADYPVTPDIVGELQAAVVDAADAGRLSLGSQEALQRFNAVTAAFGLSVLPYTGDTSYRPEPSDTESYPNPSAINGYYADAGPPVVTYYNPPPDYYYLYAWVPYPFWCRGFWYPGFFVLNDFHRHKVVRKQVKFVSNHFNDVGSHRTFRIDPVARFHGKTYPGIGAHRSKHFISTGIPKSDRKVFNAPPGKKAPEGIGAPWGTPGKGPPPWGSPAR
ncbi:MAG TPA: hypothetical protein PLR20_02065 [Syntrophales bacterium]|nr:hypothetical protein [Syntrophales bacterium]HOX94475.1 hypothetical protein [Syntrophales bacterium]HPN25626.1 hypothetical protein [Syntrophales bacterium]HQM28116.1 hypothetical protein [Syntrophales bacterium]